MKNFESFWRGLLKDLGTPKKIKNWTVKKGYFGEDFTAHTTSYNVIICTTMKGSQNNARKIDFELIYNNWEGYLSGRITREILTKKSFVTKYTISIIHQYLNK